MKFSSLVSSYVPLCHADLTMDMLDLNIEILYLIVEVPDLNIEVLDLFVKIVKYSVLVEKCLNLMKNGEKGQNWLFFVSDTSKYQT
jgi:hypothetical protein